MEALTNLLTKFIKLDADKLFLSIIFDNKEFVLDLNRLQQLFEKGIDSEGKKLGVYSPVTEFLNEGQTFSYKGESHSKLAGEDIFLFDTGKFYASFKMGRGKDHFIIDADGQKETTNLFDEYGQDIVGLTEDNKTILANFVQQEIVPLILQKL